MSKFVGMVNVSIETVTNSYNNYFANISSMKSIIFL